MQTRGVVRYGGAFVRFWSLSHLGEDAIRVSDPGQHLGAVEVFAVEIGDAKFVSEAACLAKKRERFVVRFS